MAITAESLSDKAVGVIAGNGSFPLRFAKEAKDHNCRVVAVCHLDETSREIEGLVDKAEWIKVGQLGKIISTFKSAGVEHVAMAGGIDRVRLFGGVKLDARGAALILKLRSTKDDTIMRGIADELAKEGIEVIDCTVFLRDCLVEEKIYTKAKPSSEELEDIAVGVQAIDAMRGQHIGQVVVVRDGVVVAVEAVEGTDATIKRGGELGGKGGVVVKFAKPDQDMRFDVPTIGVKTIHTMIEAKAKVLALEAGRSLLLDEEEVVALANKNKIAVVGCAPLVSQLST